MGFAKKSFETRWRSAAVPFEIEPSLSAAKRQVIRNAIAMWESQTCIRFIERREADSDFVEFVEATEGCQTESKEGGGRVEIRCTFLPFPGLSAAVPVAHEIGHAIGLIHEHKRPDRDHFVIVSNPAVSDKQYAIASDELPIGQYDCRSLMHYRRIPGKRGTAATRRGRPMKSSRPAARNGTYLPERERQVAA